MKANKVIGSGGASARVKRQVPGDFNFSSVASGKAASRLSGARTFGDAPLASPGRGGGRKKKSGRKKK